MRYERINDEDESRIVSFLFKGNVIGKMVIQNKTRQLRGICGQGKTIEGYSKEMPFDKTFENIGIQTSGSTYYIKTQEGHELTFEKVGQRVMKDSRGYRYYQAYKEQKRYFLLFKNMMGKPPLEFDVDTKIQEYEMEVQG